MRNIIKILFLSLFFIAFGKEVFSQKLPKKINEQKALERLELRNNRIENLKQNAPVAKILLLKEKFISNKY